MLAFMVLMKTMMTGMKGMEVLLLQPLLLLLAPGRLNKESGYVSEIHFRSAAVRISPLSDYKSSAHGHSELLAALSPPRKKNLPP